MKDSKNLDHLDEFPNKSPNKEITEIKDIQWLTKDEALNKCRDYHTSRINLIEKIFNFIEIIGTDKYSLIY